jgi:S1-C subfamily serine protease
MVFRPSTMTRITVFAVAVWLCLVSAVIAQDAVPSEMLLQRTFFIKVGDVGGTAFTIDYRGKLYLITARHVVAGLPESNATIQVRRAGKWEDFHTIRTLFPPSRDADIAVFETDEKVSQPFKVTTMGKMDGVTMGQQVWFLGYPFGGMGSPGPNNMVIPFMKRGTMSAMDGANPDAVVLYIDGFNNPGFSGGPIVFWNFTSHTYQIIGVVQGYKEDTAKVLVNGVHMDTKLLVNSGILIGYSIQHGLDAIDKEQEKRP